MSNNNDITTNKTHTIYAPSLIPEAFSGLKVGSISEILALGEKNITGLKIAWRRVEEKKLAEIKEIIDAADMLEKCTSTVDLERMAQSFQGTLTGEYFGGAVTARMAKSCTLNFCGWCKFSTAAKDRSPRGQHTQYLCHVEEAAAVNKSLKNAYESCTLVKMTDEELASYSAKISGWVDHLISKRQEVGEKIKYLSKLEKDARVLPSMPLFTQCRTVDYYQHAKHYVYYDSFNKKFVPAKFLKISEDNLVYLNKNGVSSIDGCISSPDIMLLEEFEILRTCPEVARQWIEVGSIGHGTFDKERFLYALSKSPAMVITEDKKPDDMVGSSHAAKLCK